MVSVLRVLTLVLCVVAFAAPVCAQEIADWPAPAIWTPAREHGRLHTMSAITGPLPFIGVTPCRQYDSRNSSPLPQNTAREVVMIGAPCGIPSSAAAVSLNVTVFDILGQSGNAVLQVGTTSNPTTAWINYPPGQGQIGNAGVLPLTGDGGVFFRVQQGGGTIDFTIDINGYYGGPTEISSNVFLGPSAGNSTMTGNQNVGVGMGALSNLTSGFANTAFGNVALGQDNAGSGNTAIGDSALFANQFGSNNTAVGVAALNLCLNSTGNTGVGYAALVNNVDGSDNVAIGAAALHNITTGSDDNIAVGEAAAINLTSGAHNIHIGNPASSSDSNTIRIGTDGVHTKFFVAGVRGVTTGEANGVGVFIDGGGQLGTISSSARVKREIDDVGEETWALLKLRPVSFLYRNDTIGIRQYGLIAEEVAAVMPELVQFSEAGEPEAVRYHFLPPLLLKEFQKQQKTIGQQNETIAGLEARLARLEARLSTESGR